MKLILYNIGLSALVVFPNLFGEGFVAGTLIPISQDSYMAIEKLKIGDLVQSGDAEKKYTMNHPYKKYVNSPAWSVLDQALTDLVANQDLEEITAREYIIGYLLQSLDKEKLLNTFNSHREE
jgi:hypothetical protein